MGWTTQTVAGVTKTLCLQDGEWTCQMAATATVINRYGGGQPTENAIVQRSRQNVGGYQTPVQERPGFRQALPGMAIPPPRQPSGVGTYNQNMVPTLEAYKIAAAETGSPSFNVLQNAMNHASQQRPLVLREPSHIVVCEGPWPGVAGSYIICDPGRGLNQAQLANGNPHPQLQYGGQQFPIDRMWTTAPDTRPEYRTQVM